VPVLGKCGVVGDLLIEAETGEPPPGQMHAQFLHQLALAGDAVQIADQQNPQQKLGIDRGSPGVAVALPQSLAHKLETDVLIDQAQQMIFRNLIFKTEVIEQRLRAGVVLHHDQQASES
jgi:hypothetical protein